MSELTRRWVIDDILILLKKIFPFFNFFSKRHKLLLYFFFKNERYKNTYLKNIHKNKSCYILGNGLSASDLDIKKLNSSYVFACNEIFLHNQFKDLKIDYYTIMEPFYGRIMGRKYVEDISRLYSEVSIAFKNKKTTLFFNATLKFFLKKHKLFEKNKIRFIIPTEKSNKQKTPLNNLDGIFNFGGGAFNFMIASAIYMGFNKIYLIGCGYTYSPRQEFHFYSRPSYLKSKYDYESMIQKVQKDYLEKGLNLISVEENNESYLPVLTRPFIDDNNSRNQVKIKEFAINKKTEIINILPKNFKSPVFNSIYSSDIRKKNYEK